MSAVGKAGLAVLAMGAVAVWFLMAPQEPAQAVFTASAEDYASMIETALSDYRANDTRTESAPQQQVVNGWVAKDLLTIVAHQNVDLLESLQALGEQAEDSTTPVVPDQRVPALLVLVVVAICWTGISIPAAPAPEGRLDVEVAA